MLHRRPYSLRQAQKLHPSPAAKLLPRRLRPRHHCARNVPNPYRLPYRVAKLHRARIDTKQCQYIMDGLGCRTSVIVSFGEALTVTFVSFHSPLDPPCYVRRGLAVPEETVQTGGGRAERVEQRIRHEQLESAPKQIPRSVIPAMKFLSFILRCVEAIDPVRWWPRPGLGPVVLSLIIICILRLGMN